MLVTLISIFMPMIFLFSSPDISTVPDLYFWLSGTWIPYQGPSNPTCQNELGEFHFNPLEQAFGMWGLSVLDFDYS